MQLKVTEEQSLIVSMVRRFVHEKSFSELNLDPDADEIPLRTSSASQKPRPWAYLADIPPEFGGPDIDLVTRTLLAIEMAQHRAGLYVPCYAVFWRGLSTIIRGHRGSKEALPLPHARREKKGFFGLSEPLGDRPARAIR